MCGLWGCVPPLVVVRLGQLAGTHASAKGVMLASAFFKAMAVKAGSDI